MSGEHSGALPGHNSTIGYSPALGATIGLFVNSEVTPNTLLSSALPAINLAAIIQQALYSQVKLIPSKGLTFEAVPGTETICPAV